MGMLKEFKEFALRGNVIDMAVGVIIGGAFGKIVSSVVSDMIMPPVGALMGSTKGIKELHVNISEQMRKAAEVTKVAMDKAAEATGVAGEKASGAASQAAPAASLSLEEALKKGDACLQYGKFISECIDFIILAFCIFMMVKLMNYLMKKKEEAPPPPAAPPADVALLTEIRDLLAKRG